MLAGDAWPPQHARPRHCNQTFVSCCRMYDTAYLYDALGRRISRPWRVRRVPPHRHVARSATYDQHSRVVMLSETRSYIHEYTRSQHSKLCNTAQICWFVRDEHCIEHQRAKRKKPSQTINATAPVRQTALHDPVMLETIRQSLSDVYGSRKGPRRVAILRCSVIIQYLGLSCA